MTTDLTTEQKQQILTDGFNDCRRYHTCGNYISMSDVVTGWWVDYEGLEELPQTLNYLQMFYKEEVKALENKDIDYIALSCNL